MRSRGSGVFLSVSILLGATAVAGCSDGSDSPAADPSNSATAVGSNSPSATPSPTATPDVTGALLVRKRGGSVDCAEVTSRSEFGLWEDSLRATVPLRIVGVQAAGSGAEALGGIAVPVLDPEGNGVIFDDWPPSPPKSPVSKSVDWKARADLTGLRMAAGEEIRPVLHVAGAPGDRLRGVEVSFATEDGDNGGSVLIPVDLRFARHCSR